MSAVTKVLRLACQMWVPLAVLALTLTATTWPATREAKRRGSDVLERVVAARVTDVPSHNRRYLASLELTNDTAWTLRLRFAAGEPVPNARVEMKAWMPEQERISRDSTITAVQASGGSYRVRPLSLDRAGWWNISVRIIDGQRSDSLAFNLILK